MWRSPNVDGHLIPRRAPARCSDAGGESEEEESSEDESLASEGDDDSEYDEDSDEEAGAVATVVLAGRHTCLSFVMVACHSSARCARALLAPLTFRPGLG